MIKGITFDNQNVASQNDGILYAKIFATDGVLFGCEYKILPEAMNITNGYMLIGGRVIQFEGVTEVKFQDPITTGYARVYLTIDMSKPSLEEDFQQVYIGVDYNASIDFPALKQEEINVGGVIYQCELAVVKIEDKNAKSVTRRISDVKIDAATVDGKKASEMTVRNALRLNNTEEALLIVNHAQTAEASNTANRAAVATNAEKLNNQIASQMSVAKAANADRASVAANAEKLNNQVASQMSVSYASSAGTAANATNAGRASVATNAEKLNNQVASQMSVNYAASAGSANTANRASVANNAEKLNNQIASQMSVNYANSCGTANNAVMLGGKGSGSYALTTGFMTYSNKTEMRYPNGASMGCWNDGAVDVATTSSKGFCVYTNGTWGAVNAARFNANSSRENKEDITEFTGALEQLMNLAIYKYKRKGSDMPQLGLIIEDEATPVDILYEWEDEPVPVSDEADGEAAPPAPMQGDNIGVDLYSFISLTAEGVKELKEEKDREIAALNKRIDDLEKRLAALEK